MAILRCDSCGTECELDCRPGDGAVVRGLLQCICGIDLGFSLEPNPAVVAKTHHRTAPVHPEISEPVRQLLDDAEVLFWLMAYAGSLAASRAAIETGLREKGLVAGGFAEIVDEALERALLDPLHRAQIRLSGMLTTAPSAALRTRVTRAHASAGLRAASSVLSFLANTSLTGRGGTLAAHRSYAASA